MYINVHLCEGVYVFIFRVVVLFGNTTSHQNFSTPISEPERQRTVPECALSPGRRGSRVGVEGIEGASTGRSGTLYIKRVMPDAKSTQMRFCVQL